MIFNNSLTGTYGQAIDALSPDDNYEAFINHQGEMSQLNLKKTFIKFHLRMWMKV